MADSFAANAPDTAEPRPRRGLFQDDRDHVVPPGVASFGMWLFLIGLALLFASGMLAYGIIRVIGANMPPLGEFRADLLNGKLFLSTAIVLAASFTIEMAVRQVRRERRPPFLRWLYATAALAVAFLIVQTPAMLELLRLDPGAGPALAIAPEARETRLYALIFFFVLLHALHVIGGVIGLGIVVANASAGAYDHENYMGVRNTARYWHFLDGVWILMFGTFVLLG